MDKDKDAKNLPIPKNLEVNIDKNISFNILSITNAERQTEIIIKSLLLYLSYSIFEEVYETDLFGFITLDPYKFAETMKLSRTTLNRKHPNPAWKLRNPDTVPARFDSYLGNALYILSTHNFIQHYYIREGNNKINGVKNFMFIEEAQEVRTIVNKGRREKIQYKIKLDKRYENNLKEFFLKSNLNHFITFKESSSEDFYLYIINLYHTYRIKDMNHYVLNFDEVVKYLKINIKNTKENKRLIKSKINGYFKNVIDNVSKDIPGLNFYWIKGQNESYAYTPVMEWTKLEKEILEADNNSVMYKTFKKMLRKELYMHYIKNTTNPIFAEEAFFAWISSKKNYNVIYDIYSELFHSFFYSKGGRNYSDMTRKEVEKIAGLETIEDMRNYFD
ncbi:hypothetical protein [Capnocytophaga canis]|uniref:hypothetical protein n=2 Tax=Capnocytophaga canis TaxID=1848903 RepID=UPI0015629F92|nr:hypothetical protein [Capnocytophaga canis]